MCFFVVGVSFVAFRSLEGCLCYFCRMFVYVIIAYVVFAVGFCTPHHDVDGFTYEDCSVEPRTVKICKSKPQNNKIHSFRSFVFCCFRKPKPPTQQESNPQESSAEMTSRYGRTRRFKRPFKVATSQAPTRVRLRAAGL